MGIKNIIGELQVDGVVGASEVHIGGENAVVIDAEGIKVNGNTVISSEGALDDYIPTSQKGAASGVATLDTAGKVPTSQLPTASGTDAGITLVYPAASCTTFSSDSGTVTPLAVQKGAKMFAITRPTSVTDKAITRYSGTDGSVQNSKIIIEDVTNTKNTSKKANVIAVPAEGNKKMVYGYCTDQTDGTAFIGGLFDADATQYPYAQGLAIGGTSGNLLWKGNRIIDAKNIAEYANNYTLPAATNSTLGGVKTGSNITNTSGTISLTKDNVTTALGYTPADADGNAVTSVYETKTDATTKFNQLSAKIDDMTPIRGEDYWTEEDVESIVGEANTLIADEMAKKAQLIPEFANSTEECTDTNKLYVLPDNQIYGYVRKGTISWTNAVTTSMDLMGAGVFTNGYADNYYVSDVNQTRENGCVATAFIPYAKKSDGSFPTIYIKGLPWKTTDSRWRCYVYTSIPTLIYGSSNILNMIGTNANLWTNFTVQNYTNGQWVDVASQTETSTYWRLVPKTALSANIARQTVAYLRMSFGANSGGTGENLIISIGNPIETTYDYGWHSTGHEFVSIPTNDPIVQEIIHEEVASIDIKPEFANSLEELEQLGDTSKLYVLPDNYIYTYSTELVNKYTNAVTTSTDADGNIYNGVGYKNSTYVSENSWKDCSQGAASTGHIPYARKADKTYPTIYVKGLAWDTTKSHSRLYFSTKGFYMVYGKVTGTTNFDIQGTNDYLTTNFTIEKKVGDTWVATTAADTGTYWRLTPNSVFTSEANAYHGSENEIAYMRMSLIGDGANIIISIDEPIEAISDYSWHSTGHKFVSIPTEDPIVQEIIHEEVASIDIKPEFANSIEECTDTSRLYVLPDNYIYACMDSEYTGEIREKITDGFLNNTRLSTSGDETRDAAGFVTTPYIDISKYPDGFTIKLSGIEWCTDGTSTEDGYAYHLSPATGANTVFSTGYIRNYNKLSSGGYNIICDATTKEVTITTTSLFKRHYGKVRFSGKGTSANAVVEVIYNGTTTGEKWINTGNKFVSVPTEDPIVQEIIKDNIADLRVEMEFVDSTDYMTDTSKVYVLDNPDDVNNGYIYTYRNTKTIVQNWKNILPDGLTWPDGTGTNYAPGLYHGIYVTSNPGGTSPDTNCTITSKIPYTKDNHPDLYIKGINWDSSSSHSRVGTWMEGVHDAAKATINIADMPSMGLTVETLGTNYYKLKCIDPYATNLFYYSEGSVVGVTHIILSFDNLNGNEEIIVSYEPIEDTVVDGWQWARSGLQFIPADYEDRIINLENRTSTLESIIDDISIDGSGVPVYIANEAQRVAEIVQSKRTVGSLTFTAMSDAHVEVDTTNTSIQNNMTACRDAGLGLAELQKYLKLDLTVMLGDYTWADNAETVAQVKKDLTYVKKCMTDGMKGLPNIWCTGNHDINYGTNSDKRMTEDDLYAYLIGNNTGTIQDSDNIGRNYGYVDFENQRIRCIYLNTIDSLDYPDNTGVADDAEEVTAIQAQWLVDVGLNFSNKSEPTKWGTVFFSHHCLSLYPAVTKILTAYKDGTNGSVNITTNGVTTAVNYNFASTNRGEIICAVHGHNHNFNLRKISDEAYYNITEAKAWLWSIGVPNVDTTRSNEVASYKDANGQPSAYALAFGQFTDETKTTPLTYPKTKGTAASTSFCVITIDRKNRKVHAITYGAGAIEADREIDY